MSFFSNRLASRFPFLGSGLAILLLSTIGVSQTAPEIAQTPISAESGFLQNQGAQPRFEAVSKMSGEARTAMSQGHILSVPHFSGVFAWQSKNYRYTLVGKKPQSGGTTVVPTQIIPISLFFEEFVDESGGHIILDPAPILPHVENSPNFHGASYQADFTQFADAVQRAQFFHSMAQDWHTLLAKPQMLKAVVIDVPRGAAKVYRNPSTGVLYAVVDSSFFISQLNTIIQLADMQADALAIALTTNVFLAPEADIKHCCLLGFHTSFDSGRVGNTQLVQTFLWASWVDQGILGTNLADVTPMSHEISEWMNNPFGTNLVPAWQVPGVAGGCQENLETADPLASLPNAGYPVLIDGFVYHPQTQVMMQWFQRQSSSDAMDGAFSFPDQTLVTTPSQACPAR